MNLLKSALSGVASAVGTHYADEAMNPTPYDTKVYYGVAAAGAIGAFFLRNKSPIGAGLLLGLGAGSAYQGYTRVTRPAKVYSTFATPTTLGPKANPYSQFVVPTNIYPTKAPAAPQASQPTILGGTLDDWNKAAQQGVETGKKIGDLFGLGESAPVPYQDPGGVTDEEFYNY